MRSTLLEEAIDLKDLALVKELIDGGGDVNELVDGRSCLDAAAQMDCWSV